MRQLGEWLGQQPTAGVTKAPAAVEPGEAVPFVPGSVDHDVDHFASD